MPSPAGLRRLANVLLRGLTLACRLLLVLLLARYLLPADLGRFGLLAAAVSYALYLVGLDFYTYSTREAAGRPLAEWGGALKAQGLLVLLLYLGFLPLLAFAVARGWLPAPLAGWFLALLVLEHLNQEAGRLLVIAGAPLAGSVAYFLRAGIWVPLVAVLMAVDPSLRRLEVVLLAWGIGGGLALVVAVVLLRRLGVSGWGAGVDWTWLRRGLAVALPLLVGTLALRAMLTLDRYWLAALSSLEVVGAYVMFAGIAQTVVLFLDAAVFSFAYPGLIRAYRAGDAADFRRGLRRLLWHTVLLTGGFAVAALLLVHPLLDVLDNPFYAGQLALFHWAVLYSTLYALGMVPHFALYAQGHDRPLLQAHLLGLAVFATTTALLAGEMAALAVPSGLALAFLVVLAWKVRAYRRLTPPAFRFGAPPPARP